MAEQMREIIKTASQFRTAVRVYSDRKVAREDMELILDIAHESRPPSV